MEEQNLHALRHSAEHILTQAMERLWPGKIIKAMGPAIENGFYFDFDTVDDLKVTETDFSKIEKEMRKIVQQNLSFERVVVTANEARKMFAGNGYKQEWIDKAESEGEEISVYWTGDPGKGGSFVDVCAGPHVAKTIEVKAFKLLSVAGAYWHGDEKNKMLTRIYGTAFETQEELDKYLADIEEAKMRDHRKIGQDLGLFVFSDLIGKGLPIFTAKGATIRREMERFTIDEELKRGYNHVVTPDLAKVDLYKKSGHYPYYKDTMYPIMKVDEEELILRPMTCPHHFMYYKSQQHSYRDLPYRIAEMAHQYRYEKSGELSGLTRVRMFCLADAHIIAPKEQAKQTIEEVLELIDFINQTLGMVKGEDYRYRLSLGDRLDGKKYYKDDDAWDYAESVLREVLTEIKAPFFEAKNEAAFYGPKIDIQVKRAGGNEETAFTVQYDFVMPERFDLTFTNKEGKEERPIVIHRSSIGCIERTMAFLIEKYKGAFPVWLSPVQVAVLPISEKTLDYAKQITDELKESGLRVQLNTEADSLGKKIRNAEAEKVPYMLIIGEKEAEAKQVSVRQRGQKDLGTMKASDFAEKVIKEVEEKSIL